VKKSITLGRSRQLTPIMIPKAVGNSDHMVANFGPIEDANDRVLFFLRDKMSEISAYRLKFPTCSRRRIPGRFDYHFKSYRDN